MVKKSTFSITESFHIVNLRISVFLEIKEGHLFSPCEPLSLRVIDYVITRLTQLLIVSKLIFHYLWPVSPEARVAEVAVSGGGNEG